MRRSLLYGAATALALGGPVKAAQFDVRPLDSGIPVVWVIGTIDYGDLDAFTLRANQLTGKAIVALESQGGNLVAALRIGEYVRLKGWATFVYDECDSACAAIWLAGVPRLMSQFAKIGFHAASLGGMEKGTGNALFGAYMTRLGLGYAAVGWATSASPTDIAYLTPAKAKELGIDVEVIGLDQQANSRPAPPPQRPALGPPMRITPMRMTEADCIRYHPREERNGMALAECLNDVSSRKPFDEPGFAAAHFQPRTLRDLHLRSAPDPRAADVLPPNEFIPKGTELSIVQRNCTVWTGSGRGAQDADNVWCPTTYGTQSGWVNAYFIWTDSASPMACVLYPSARGCEKYPLAAAE
jgi:hypothetical protein